MSLSNYPPGVSGNEPEITGEWPCVACGGVGGDYERDEDGYASGSACWWCRGTGIEPEDDPPACPGCGDDATEFLDFDDDDQHVVIASLAAVLSAQELSRARMDGGIFCHACGQVSLP